MLLRTRLLAGVALLAVSPAVFSARVEIDAGRYLEHVKYLASELMRGRGTGTAELDRAADYLAAQFREVGLRSVEGSEYAQRFPVTLNARLGENNSFVFTAGASRTGLKFRQDFQPFNFSASGRFRGRVVFAGYGITAREYNYDDYAELDVKDKFVVVLRHEPQQYDEKSVFAGKIYTEHSQFFSKAVNAKLHGARGVILVNDPVAKSGESDQLEPFSGVVGPNDARIPFVQVKQDIIERWLAPTGKTLKDLQDGIDRDLKARSFQLPDDLELDVEVDLVRDSRQVRNILGYLPGETDEYVVVGAHYDHLGLGEQFSMAPSMAGTVHPGADDNASGTAGVLELARHFASGPKRKRGILFQLYAGEELGLLGSSYYVNHPQMPLNRAVAMINMDMIGRIREGKVYVGGIGTATNFRPLMDEVTAGSDLKFDLSANSGYGSSDHTSFTAKQVPVLFFFSGLHGDYHKPSDTWDKIDAQAAVTLLRTVAAVIDRLAQDEARPQFVRVADPKPSVHAGDAPRSGGGGYGPYFGSIPDFNEPPSGVRFADVRDGSPAALGGLKAGDVLIEFDGKPVQNLYDFTVLLRTKKPGDEVEVKVLRGSETVVSKVKLVARK